MPSRILIADDNPAVRAALRQLLSRADREILEAEDGSDAVAKTLENRPHVAILDLVMPNLDGLSAAREISRQLPEVALVMCTMHWSTHLQVEAQRSGVRKVVSKAEGCELVSTVDELLACRPSPDSAPPPSTIETVASPKEDPATANRMSSEAATPKAS